MCTWIHVLHPLRQRNLQQESYKRHCILSKYATSVKLGLGAWVKLGVCGWVKLRLGASVKLGLSAWVKLALGVTVKLALGVSVNVRLGISDRYPNLAPTPWSPQPQRCPKATA